MIRSTRSQSTGSAGAGRFHDCIPESDNAGWHTGSVAIGHCADSPWLRLGTCFEDSAADFRETPTELLVHRPVPAGTSRMKACQHCWHAPAPSMPARKHYTVRRHHFPLDVPEQCCGVCLSTLTSRGSTDGYSRTTPAIRCPARPTPAPSCSGCTPPARVLADDGRDDAGDRRRYEDGARRRSTAARALAPCWRSSRPHPFGGTAKPPAEMPEMPETSNP